MTSACGFSSRQPPLDPTTMPRPLDVRRLARILHEILILGTLRHEPLHGYKIAVEIKEKTCGAISVAPGTLYPILHQLEHTGLIHGSWDGGHGRRPRRRYVITPDGGTYLLDRAAEWRDLNARLVALMPQETSGVPSSVPGR